MRIALTSDLHVDHHPEVAALVAARVRVLEVDTVIVAGDVSTHLDHLEAALTTIRPAARRAVFVPGNHDLWQLGDGPSSRARYEELVPARAANAGFDALGAEPVDVDGRCFAGVTGWFDFSLRNRALDDVFKDEHYRTGAWGRLRWNDNQRIVWPGDDGAPLDAQAICDEQIASLETQLASAEGREVVVVTHHLPFAELVTSRGEPPWDFLNGFMGAERLGAAIRRTPNVKLACAGHTHFRHQRSIEGVSGPFVAAVSPIGYPREYKRGGQDLAARVEERVMLIEI